MKILRELIAGQQKGHEKEPVFMIGMQLLDIAEREPASAELLEKDLQTNGMKLTDAAAELKKYADTHHGSAKCFCITPDVAEDILRKFYGLPEKTEKTEERAPKEESKGFIDLGDFL